MRAIRFHETGGPEVLRLEEVETPTPGPGQVLIRNHAIGINFIETYQRSGLYPVKLPYQLKVERATPAADMKVALAWHLRTTPNAEVIWHNGGTGGFRTWMGFDRKARVGAVVMTNTANAVGGDDIGFHILAGTALASLKVNAATQPVVSLTQAQMDGLAGRYQLAPTVVMTIVTYNGRLFGQLTGQQGAELFPTSPTEVFWKVVDAQATFDRGPDGKATRLVLHQNGRDLPGARIP